MSGVIGDPAFRGRTDLRTVTATIDWCEQNFLFSHVIAEPVNTLTNIPFALQGLAGVRDILHHDLPRQLLLINASFVSIGLGSFYFHASLTYTSQLLDELPMIFAACAAAWCLFLSPAGATSSSGWWTSGLIFLALGTLISILYTTVFRSPVFHQSCYAALQVLAIARIYHLVAYRLVANRVKGKHETLARKRSQIKRLFTAGSIIFSTGFLAWNLDNAFCDSLRAYRFSLGGGPGGSFLPELINGHGLWHLATGYGGFLHCKAIELLIVSIDRDMDDYELRWWVLHPYVARRDRAKKRLQ